MVSAAKTATRLTTAAPTSPGLLIPVFGAGQVENCLGECSVSVGALRSSILLKLVHAGGGCERRRDACTIADFGDLNAAKARLCQDRANRQAYAAASHPCQLTKKKP